MNTLKEMSLIAGIKEFFGYRQGQTMPEFMAEVRELTPEDRDYFRREMTKVGYKLS